MKIVLILLGLALIPAAFVGRTFAKRRQFYRRNAAGIEQFQRYSAMIKTQFKEGLVQILSFVVSLIGIVIFVYALSL